MAAVTWPRPAERSSAIPLNSGGFYGFESETLNGWMICSLSPHWPQITETEKLANTPPSAIPTLCMELRQLRYFNAVAELLNFSRAAEHLHVAQSALSRQIQALEHEIGAQLLDRDRAHVSLTDAGKVFYGHTCKLLLQVDVAVTDAQQIARGATGKLVICTDWRFDSQFVSTAVEQLRRKHARVEIALRDAGFKDQIAMIRSGDAHLGFIARGFIGKNSELQFLFVRRVYVNVVLPAGHPFAKRKAVRLSELAKETWVDLSEKEAVPFRAYFMQQCRLSGYTLRFGKTADTLAGLFGHVASGYGISATPDHAHPHPGLALCCVRTDCPPIEFGAVWRASNQSPLLQHFVNILRQQIATARPPRGNEAGVDSKKA
jgi:LysR family transcriptional regulator, benzoate and cis,cis-muconate-responsive activator of ben and cat genes